jgi:hypothetical protein
MEAQQKEIDDLRQQIRRKGRVKAIKRCVVMNGVY